MTKTCVVFTTIFPPTPALEAWRAHGQLIGVGDVKTPADWHLEGCHFIRHGDDTAGPFFSRFLPDNHYCRKNLAYAEAIRQGADVIIDTDDDNHPKKGWDYPPFDGSYDQTSHQEFVNAYRFFTDKMIWPRGFPLSRVLTVFDGHRRDPKAVKVGVWQGLANGDPDVDAIFRLTRGGDFTFDDNDPVVLPFGSVCPFNSQNTIVRRELFPLLYLPAVSFRFTDILRGLVAQPIMWQHGYSLGFTWATVNQNRNPHDYMKDFESELPVYRHARDIHRIVAEAIKPAPGLHSLCEDLWLAYSALKDAGIVEPMELNRLWPWLNQFGE